MSSGPTVDVFKGADWEECDGFIRAIRARALWEGKQRDSAWMADFAAPLFSRKALTWHCRLSQDIRQDWSKLEIALLDRWAPPEDDDKPQTEPTPAAALPLNHRHQFESPIKSVLKVVLDESKTTYYVEFSGSTCVLTQDVRSAVHIRCNFLSEETLVERVGYSCHSWLAVQWDKEGPNMDNGSTDYCRLPFVNSDTLKSSWQYRTLWQLMSCTVSVEGEVNPFWKKDDTSKIPLGAFVRNNSLYLAPDPDAYSKYWTSEKKAKLFIESIQ